MQRLLRISPIFLLLLAITCQLIAESKTQMFLDFARFRYDETDTYLEIYYMLYQTDKQATPEKEVWVGFSFYDTTADTMLSSKKMKVDLSGATESGKVGLIKTHVPPGAYRIKMTQLDKTGTVVVDSVQKEFTTAAFNHNKITLSDVEICSNIVLQSKQKGTFFKNTMEVIPNPSGIFGNTNSLLYYYVELYNVAPSNEQDFLEIHVAIEDNSGKIYQKNEYKISRNNEARVEQGAFDILSLKSGWYNLLFAVIDSSADYSVFKFNKFYVLGEEKTGGAATMLSFSESEYFNMPSEKLQQRFEQITYIATNEERRVYKTLDDVDAKRNFLYQFWASREKDSPGLQQAYYSRIDFADEHYSYSGLVGWKTDMGRVYIVYGEPSQIERFPSEPRTRPYEIWYYYDFEGGTQFVFVDVNGYDDFRLVTSTVRNEIYDPNWKTNYLLVD